MTGDHETAHAIEQRAYDWARVHRPDIVAYSSRASWMRDAETHGIITADELRLVYAVYGPDVMDWTGD